MKVARDFPNRNKFNFVAPHCPRWFALAFSSGYPCFPLRRTEDQDHYRTIKRHSDHKNLVENNVSSSDNIFSKFCFLRDVWPFHNPC